MERSVEKQWKALDPQTVLDNGDSLRFRLQASFPGYLYAYYRGSGGEAEWLYPSPASPSNNRIESGATYLIPSTKLLELSDGRVVAVAETPLGFRHGPKTIVNRRTLVVLFLCNDPYTRRYEIDLLNELRADGAAGRVIALSGSAVEGAAGQGAAAAVGAACADDIVLPGGCAAANLELCFPYAVFAQTFAFLSSLALGLRPDTPNAAGFVNRVVQGVTIYPWNEA